MIIVSQDKKTIVNFNQLQTIEINVPRAWNQGFYSIDTYPLGEGNQSHIRLAKYGTEERAKEVLQEIIRCYSDTEGLKCIVNINGCLKSKWLNELAENSFIYRIPEE